MFRACWSRERERRKTGTRGNIFLRQLDSRLRSYNRIKNTRNANLFNCWLSTWKRRDSRIRYSWISTVWRNRRSTGSFESPRANNQDRIGEEGHQCKWRYYHRSPSSYVTCQHRSPASARRYQPWNRLLPIRIWLRVIFFFENYDIQLVVIDSVCTDEIKKDRRQP